MGHGEPLQPCTLLLEKVLIGGDEMKRPKLPTAGGFDLITADLGMPTGVSGRYGWLHPNAVALRPQCRAPYAYGH
jgi:hypothetical protein